MPSRPQFLVGTASWTDPTLVKSDTLSPRSLKTAEERLRFYAAQFNTVEVDATYYALVSERNAALWAERLKSLSGVRRASVIFNNCYSNFGVMNAATMAQMLRH